MTITLQPETEQYLEEEAKREGLRDAATLVQRLIDRHKAQRTLTKKNLTDEEVRQSDAWRVIERLTGTATRNITTDELMAETRSEV